MQRDVADPTSAYVKEHVLQSYRNGVEKGRSESALKRKAGPTQSVEADSEDTLSVPEAPHVKPGAGSRAWLGDTTRN